MFKDLYIRPILTKKDQYLTTNYLQNYLLIGPLPSVILIIQCNRNIKSTQLWARGTSKGKARDKRKTKQGKEPFGCKSLLVVAKWKSHFVCIYMQMKKIKILWLSREVCICTAILMLVLEKHFWFYISTYDHCITLGIHYTVAVRIIYKIFVFTLFSS